MGDEASRLLSRLAPVHAAATIRLPRPRYMYMVSLLRKLRAPTQRVRTADLANVVNGRTDVPLPPWSEDHAFEQELEALLDDDVCWVCSGCDTIVSFFALEKGDTAERFTQDFLVVFNQEASAKCPYCGSRQAYLLDPSFFWRGEQAPPPEALAAVASTLLGDRTEARAKTPANALTAHEALLEKILRDKANVRPGEDVGVLRITDFQLRQLCEAANAHPQDGAFYSPLGTQATPAKLREMVGFDQVLRPLSEPNRKNVLGMVWDEVLSMIPPEHGELRRAAVGVAQCQGLSASAHFERQTSAMAIVLEYGLQNTLYNLNHLVYLATAPATEPERSPDELLLHMIGYVAAETRLHGPFPSILQGYRSEDAFRLTHLLTTAQLQFILLHELGHLLQWEQGYEGRETPAARDGSDTHLVEERQADSWAVERLRHCGERYHTLAFQLFAISWLFEFWHMAESLCPLTAANMGNSRLRWDCIARAMKPARHGGPQASPGGEMSVPDRRSRIDKMVEVYKQWQATNMP